MKFGECRIIRIGFEDCIESSRLCPPISIRPSAVVSVTGRWTSTERTIIAHPKAHRLEKN
jgi:hypothetical protein